jgi:hypothetical protein
VHNQFVSLGENVTEDMFLLYMSNWKMTMETDSIVPDMKHVAGRSFFLYTSIMCVVVHDAK